MRNEPFILSQFDRLVASGVVLCDEKQEMVEVGDGKLKFQFCLTSALARKPNITTDRPSVGSHPDTRNERLGASDIDTAGFEMGDINPTHFLAANKFCWARPHLMILTRDGHQRQYEPLLEPDLDAAWLVLSALGGDYVAFYNCGQDAGCSRLHKHMQVIPAPEKRFASFLDSEGEEPKVPFQWFYHRFDSQNVTVPWLTMVYNDLLEQATAAGMGHSEHATSFSGTACPQNVILTKRWIMVVPRRQAAVNQEAAANAIGMLGYIAIATRGEIDSWKQWGLSNCLRQLGVPK